MYILLYVLSVEFNSMWQMINPLIAFNDPSLHGQGGTRCRQLCPSGQRSVWSPPVWMAGILCHRRSGEVGAKRLLRPVRCPIRESLVPKGEANPRLVWHLRSGNSTTQRDSLALSLQEYQVLGPRLKTPLVNGPSTRQCVACLLRVEQEVGQSHQQFAAAIKADLGRVESVDKEFWCKVLFLRGLNVSDRTGLMEVTSEEESLDELSKCAAELSSHL